MAKKNSQNELKNFTMLFDDFPKELTNAAAWAYAAINRNCMKREGICRASQGTLAKQSRLTLSTFKRWQDWLIQNEYIIDETPYKNGSPHTLRINDWKPDIFQNDNLDDDWGKDDGDNDDPWRDNE